MNLFISSDLLSSSCPNLSPPVSLPPSNPEGDSTHDDFIRFLQCAQSLGVRILPLVWDPGLEQLGRDGTTGRVSQRGWNSDMQFAFKRFRPQLTGSVSLTDAQLRSLQYLAMTNEMTILSCPGVKNNSNIVLFFGIGFEIIPSLAQIRPMLIFSKATGGDLSTTDFEAEEMSEDYLLGICGEVAKGLDGLHNCSE